MSVYEIAEIIGILTTYGIVIYLIWKGAKKFFSKEKKEDIWKLKSEKNE